MAISISSFCPINAKKPFVALLLAEGFAFSVFILSCSFVQQHGLLPDMEAAILEAALGVEVQDSNPLVWFFVARQKAYRFYSLVLLM